MDNLANNDRLNWIDNAKAVGIYFVVLGHHHGHFLFDYIYSFHMPLFFFLSGMLTSLKPDVKFHDYVKKRSKALLVPYFVFSTGLFLLWWFLGRFIDPGLLKEASLMKNAIGIFYAQGQLEYMRWGVEMWFLPCLFITSMLFYFVAKLSKINHLLTVSICMVLGFYLAQVISFHLPWSLDVALVALGFYWLGNISKKYLLSFQLGWRGFALLLFFLCGNVLLHIAQSSRIDMYQAIYEDRLLFIGSATLGVLFYTLFGKVLFPSKIWLFFGANSLIFYMLHMRALTVINFFQKQILGAQVDTSNLWGAMFISLVQLLLLVPVVFIINRYLPFLIGKESRRDHGLIAKTG